MLYANHHSFFDGHLLWAFARHALDCRVNLCMREWTRFPFFGEAGALPFPDGDASSRAATSRETARRLRADTWHTLLLFPEGAMHPAEEGVLPWPADQIVRLSRILPAAAFCPIAIYHSWRDADRPVAFRGVGEAVPGASGSEWRHLSDLLLEMPRLSLENSDVLVTGKQSMNERWNFRFLAPLFRLRR